MNASPTELAVIPINQLQPDDVIVCRHQGKLTMEQQRQLHATISSNFPGFKILIHDSRASIEIHRPVPS